MDVILLGIKNNNFIHLGHLLGVILPSIKLIKKSKKYLLFILIANLHSLSSSYKNNNQYIYKIISVILSFNINFKKILIYKQSDIIEILEIFWYFNCIYSLKRLKLLHTFKKYKFNMNISSFIYPILMSVDIIIVNAKYVFIGKDQIQHIEICNILINKINIFNKYNKYIFNNVKYIISKKYNKILGNNFKKMSKSYSNNSCNIFEKKKIKNFLFKIKTSNLSIQSINIKKNYLFILYKYFFKKKDIIYFLNKCKNNKYNFYKAKLDLYNKILNKYKKNIKKYIFFLNNKFILKNILLKSKYIIKKIIKKYINIIKNKLYNYII
ncbi:MAG: tryptophan--tRNA ligase [Candidatus Shikimatogenerans sp. Ttur]|uniref:tryptophan--tRNA ligase n=1 Tax=Candidatus Shikimatogenerans sp. Ttur TaxID=3158569 RepID=A0AAU7ZYH9_9FLAO